MELLWFIGIVIWVKINKIINRRLEIQVNFLVDTLENSEFKLND